MRKEELLALLPNPETEIQLEDAEGLPRFACLNERDRFGEVQLEVFDGEQPWPNPLSIIGDKDFLGDLGCVDLNTSEVVIVSEETLSTSVKDWLR